MKQEPGLRRNLSLAKITRPRLPQIVARERLFQVLDNNRQYPIVWVTGLAGSGKTTLAASYLESRQIPCIWYQIDEGDTDPSTFFYYLGLAAKKAAPQYRRALPLLTPEYTLGIQTFAKRYFESLFERLDKPSVLVLDNYQEARHDALLHDLIAEGLASIPQGTHVYVISRSEPPASFARFQANSQMKVLDRDKLLLSHEELMDVMRLQCAFQPSQEMVQNVSKKTHGWAAGVVLLCQAVRMEAVDSENIKNLKPEKVFDYFSNEIFTRIDPPMQDFLLKTAFLPNLSVKIAEDLSSHANAGQILSGLNRRNFFTERLDQPAPTYRYHPLFREFLLNFAAKTFSAETIGALRQKAAQMLEASGQVDDAAELYYESRDWRDMARLILQNAHSLVTQGRIETLERWMLALPEEMYKADPWLLYWQGICRFAPDPSGARLHFTEAYALFKRLRDRTGLLLSWTGVVDTFLHEWDVAIPLKQWIRELKELLKQGEPFPSLEIEIAVTVRMFTSMFFIQPQDRDLPAWEQKMIAYMARTDDPEQRMMLSANLIFYYSWTGELDKMSRQIRELDAGKGFQSVSPLTRILWLTQQAVFAWFRADQEESLRLVQEALELSDRSGMHVMDSRVIAQGVFASLTAGDRKTAGSYLVKMKAVLNPKQRMDVAQYHWVSTYYYAIAGNLARAHEHAVKAEAMFGETGIPMVTALGNTCLAQVHILKKEFREAAVCIERAREEGQLMHSVNVEMQVHLLKAQMAFARGDEQRLVRALRKGLAIGREQGFMGIGWWLPSVMQSLCIKAIEYGIETEYIRELIRKRNLMPEHPPLDLDAWPWPIRITTLGRFEVQRDGKPLEFSRKVQKKPLQLLKALVAAGGKEVREDRLTYLLWPDAVGDAGHKALGINVIRLRRLIDMADAVKVKEGSISLDPRFCWTDVSAFERLLEKAREARKQAKPSLSIRLLHKAMDLYKGPFLAEDSDLWSVSLRERLRSMFLRSIDDLGTCMEQSRAYKEALRIYQRGLEVDELAEPYYQRMMVCYQKLGRYAEALSVYNRCRKTLAVHDVSPSLDTEAILASLRRQG